MAKKMVDPLGHHDWESAGYVAGWAERQAGREPNRREPFGVLAETIARDRQAAVRFLDVGAGYGGLTEFLLRHFPGATATCQDGSEEMVKLGRERMKDFAGRFDYVVGDFSRPGWSRDITGPFDAVVSAIAIHNVRDRRTIKRIYADIFPLVKPGGCFLNFDGMKPSLEAQLDYVREAGFTDVKCFWRGDHRAVFGGFRPSP
ncbi:MAG TPA: methyltransferase domain-containing protein [Candidatus Binatia bacterium]